MEAKTKNNMIQNEHDEVDYGMDGLNMDDDWDENDM